MKKTLLLFFSLLCYSSIAQNGFEKAILLHEYDEQDPFARTVYDAAESSLMNRSNINLFYWNEKLHTLNRVYSRQSIDKPIDMVKYVSGFLKEIVLNPAIQIVTDTSGKTTAVYYTINPGFSYTYKTIEVKTSKIIETRNDYIGNSSSSGLSNQINVVKFVEEFGGDPNKLKKADYKQFDKMLQKVNEKYKPIIEQRYKDICKNLGQSFASSITYFEREYSNANYKVIRVPGNEDEKKVKTISFSGTTKDKLKKDDLLYLYEIVNYENRKTNKYISKFGVEEVGEQQSTADKYGLGGKKELAELLKSENDLILFHSPQAAHNYIKSENKNLTEYNVSVKKNCLFCATGLENILMSVPVLNTIERNAPELRTFQELAKLDKFIDYNSQDLLNKQLGVQFLFNLVADNLMVTDIETGRVIGSEGTFSNSGKTVVKNLFLEAFQKDIEFLKVNEVKKNQIKEIVLYSEFGFNTNERLVIYTKEDEKVGNKVLKRKVSVAEGSVSKIISDFICILKIKDGEKELFELQNQNKPFFLEYKIK